MRAMVADDASGMEGGRSERQARKKRTGGSEIFPDSEGVDPRGRGGSKQTRKGRIECPYPSNFSKVYGLKHGSKKRPEWKSCTHNLC